MKRRLCDVCVGESERKKKEMCGTKFHTADGTSSNAMNERSAA